MVDSIFDAFKRVGAGVAQIPATPLALYGLANRGTNYLGSFSLPGGQAAEDAAVAYDNRMRNMIGVRPPQTTADYALEALGNVAVAPTAAFARAAPLADRLLRSVFVTPRTGAGRVVDFGLQTGIGAVLANTVHADAPAQPTQGDPLASLWNSRPSSTPNVPASIPPNQAVQGPNISSVPSGQAPAANDPLATLWSNQPSTPPNSDPLASLWGTNPNAPPSSPQRDEPLSWSDIAIAGAVAAGSVAAGQAVLRRLRHGVPLRDVGGHTGVNEPPPVISTVGERIAASVQDETAALRGTLARSQPNRVLVEEFNNAAGLDMNVHAQVQRTKSFWESGNAEGIVQSPVSPRAFTESVAALPPAARTQFRDEIVARNELDNIRNNTPSGVMDAATVNSIISNPNPAFARLHDDWQGITRSLLEYGYRRGLISADERTWLLANRPNYMPQSTLTRRSSLIERMMDIAPESEREAISNFRYFFDRSQGGAAGQVLADPIRALEMYTQSMFRVANLNNARRVWIDAMRSSPDQMARNAVRRTHEAGDDTVGIWRGGVKEYYRVTDPTLRVALNAAPHAMGLFGGVMNTLRRGVQFGATGLGNPFFAPVSLMYETISAVLTHPVGTRFGAFSGDVIGGTIGALTGAGRALYGGALRGMSHMLEDAWRNHTTLSQLMGPQAVAALAQRVTAAWHRSTLHSMEASGALSAGRFVTDPNVRNVYTMLDVTSPNYASQAPALRKAWESYRTIMELLQSGARTHFFAANFGRFDTRTLARMTRELSGDPSVRGTGQATRMLTTSVPYGNVAIQEAAALWRVARRNPTTFAWRTGMALGLPAMFAVWNAVRLGPDYVDHMFRRMTSEQQSTFLPIYFEGQPPEEGAFIAVPNSLRPAMVAMRDMFAAMTNATQEATYTRALDNIFSGFLSALPMSPPPIADIAANAAGYDVRSGYGGNILAITPQRGTELTGEPQLRTALPANASTVERALEHNITSGVVQAVLATGGAMALNTVRAMAAANRGGADARTVLSDAGEVVRQQGRQSMQMFNGSVWDAPARLSTQNQDARMLSRLTSNMRRVVDEYNSNVRLFGATGTLSNRTAAPGLMSTQGVADLSMVPVMAEISRFQTDFNRSHMQRINSLRQQMEGAVSNVTLSPNNRELARSNVARQLMDRQREALQAIQTFEDRLSNTFGRRITIENVSRRSRLQDFPLL